MQLLEHRAKALAAAAGITIPEGELARTPQEAGAIAHRLGARVAVKAQVPAGGRAKAGGVRLIPAGEAADAARGLLGEEVCGHRVESVLVERVIDGADRTDRTGGTGELYLAVTIKPSLGSAVLLVSGAGGIDVEAHAQEIAVVPVSAMTGLQPWHVRTAVRETRLPMPVATSILPVASAAYRLFTSQRLWLIEINPLILDRTGAATAADVRIIPGRSGQDGGQSRMDRIGADHGFDLVELDPAGVVGLISTGAGASMLLVDLLTEAGVPPINFCDLRTGGMRGDPTRLIVAFDELRSRPNLRCIAVNVFAGVTDLAEFAELFVAAYERTVPPVPVVVRIEGRDAAAARESIRALGFTCPESLEDLVDAVVRVVGASGAAGAGGAGGAHDARSAGPERVNRDEVPGVDAVG
jgi:succinyl-CoA synthetase beta subunit